MCLLSEKVTSLKPGISSTGYETLCMIWSDYSSEAGGVVRFKPLQSI